MNDKKDIINVCICTYKRPVFLKRLLVALQAQIIDDSFSFSIIVVDNDPIKSGEAIVEELNNNIKITASYFHEPRRNISYARNKAVMESTGNYVAFIDDDEFPDKFWLKNLHSALKCSKADGVLGPVLPHFENTPPKWLLKSKICERKTFKSNTVIKHSKDTRTGNALIKKEILDEKDGPFDPRFGLIGGGDSEYFGRMMKKGYSFIWHNDGIVYETVMQDRLSKMYYFKRAFARGASNAFSSKIVSTDTVKSILALIVYPVLSLCIYIFSYRLFMSFVIKICDHLGKMAGFFGFIIVKQRPYQ